MDSTWSELSYFESADHTSAAFQQRHSLPRLRPSVEEKIAEINSHVTQGRQYFAAANQAGPLARPLLLYYGVLALSRAVILFHRHNFREAALSERHGVSLDDISADDTDSAAASSTDDSDSPEQPLNAGHGVEAPGWKHQFAGERRGIDHLPDLELVIQAKGTLAELCTATRNVRRAFIPVPDEGTLAGFHHDRPGTAEITDRLSVQLTEILARVPQLSLPFWRSLGTAPACAQVFLNREPHGFGGRSSSLLLELLGLQGWWFPDIDEALRLSGLLANTYLGTEDFEFTFQAHRFRIERDSLEALQAAMPAITDVRSAGRRERFAYLVAPLPNGVELSQLALLYLVAYALGMLVRYFPTTWAQLSGRSRGDRIFPLLRRAVDLIATEYPWLVLQEFTCAQTPPSGLVMDPDTWIE